MSDEDGLADVRQVPFAPLVPSSFTEPYWDATRDRRFLVQYSEGTAQYQFFPLPTSLSGRSRDVVWREVEPTGEIYSFTVVRRGPGVFRGHEPYIVANVTLDVGVRMLGNLVDCPLEAVAIGMRVTGTWHPISDGHHLLMFRPAEVGQ